MEIETPDWLNQDFLSTVLQGGEHGEPKVQVLRFTPSLAVAPGNNYLSTMFRVKVEYKVTGSEEVKKVSLMVKAPLTKGLITEITDKMDVFSLEEKVYTELLPLLRDKANHEFGPRSYYCPVKGMVLADLKEDGYIMCDRHKQLDFHHCESALKILAWFHAASVASYHDNPELITSFEEKMFVEGPEVQEKFGLWLKTSITEVGTIVGAIEGFEAAGNYIISRAEDMLDSTIQRLKQKKLGFNVLNHADFWTNNMMFKYDESGNVEDVKMIDFQLTKYTSPAIDLMYFIWTSAREDVLERQHELINIYHQTLNSKLQELGCEERLSEEELMEDMRSSTDFAIYLISNLLPHVLSDSENLVNFEDISEADIQDSSKINATFLKMYSGKYYKAALPKVMKYLAPWLPI